LRIVFYEETALRAVRRLQSLVSAGFQFYLVCAARGPFEAFMK